MKSSLFPPLSLVLLLGLLSVSCKPQRTQRNNVWINKLFFERMVEFAPGSVVNDRCNLQVRMYREHLRNNTLWAVRMHESSTLTLGGLLSGDTNQFGHPNQCVETVVPQLDMSGQYCLALAEMRAAFPVEEEGGLTSSAWSSIFTNHTNLIKHPRTSFHWGICIPSDCSAQDVERSLREALTSGFQEAGIQVSISVKPEYCYTLDQGPLPWQAWCFVGFLVCVLILVFWATTWDYLHHVDSPTTKLSFSRAFSVIYNTRRLCKVDKNEEMTIIYGMKCLTMLTVVIGHKIMLLFGNNVSNKDRLERDTVSLAFIYFLNGTVVVDTFFVISGYLSAHQLVQHFSRSKNVPFILVVLDRIIRILPSYSLVMCFYIWVLPFINNGPLWKPVVLRESNRCHDNWWTNVLFVNNLVNDDQMCMVQSWFLAVDFQLFLFSFFFIYVAWGWPTTQAWLLGGYLAMAMAIPSYLIYEKSEWSFFIPSIKNLYDPTQVAHFTEVYVKTYNRAIPYVIGIMGAFYRQKLQERQFRFKSGMSKVFIFALVFISTFIMFLIPNLFVSPSHPYNIWEQVAYGALHRVVWALSMCSFIVMHNTGGYGFISLFLGCKMFAPLSRLCYGVYLTHIAIMLIELGSSHTSEYYTLITLAQGIFGDLLMALMASFVLNMLVESPLDTFHKKLKRIILGKISASNKPAVYPVCSNKGNHVRTLTRPTRGLELQTLPT